MNNHPKRVPIDNGSCGKEPDECESLTSGSESGVGEGIPLPTVTGEDGQLSPYRDGGHNCQEFRQCSGD